MENAYKTVLEEVETTITEKKSKFICSMKSVHTEEEALLYVAKIKKKYFDASHHCSAFIVGFSEATLERYNDDREPSGTAGKPMMEVLKGAGIKNVVAVITRYFGGVLLGTGGLIKAYTQSIKCAIEQATLYEKILCEKIIVDTEYSMLPKIEYEVLQKHQRVFEIIYSDKVTIILLIQIPFVEELKKTVMNLTNGQCGIHSDGLYYVSQIDKEVQLEEIASL